ncbi:MAG: reverse transcriptase [Burkholderiaceae bacterium]|nr:reverse transcriptase [Burkholderiaceae bacterium]
MSILKEKYKSLKVRGSSLSDVVILAQAWKKTHTFIRRHNSYADVLELDSSTVNLEKRLAEWAVAITDENFLPDDLLLVPAPKNGKWEFRDRVQGTDVNAWLDIPFEDLGSEASFQDWQPQVVDSKISGQEPSTQKLRPLAHMSIRDQCLATAVMMCLAEVVETAQGDPAQTDVTKAPQLDVVSYGNRLQCQWVEAHASRPRANFSWGNNQTYRQYFQDYRTFLSRPRRVCAELFSKVSSRRELFVISLDIKSFFDNVDTGALINELKALEKQHRAHFGGENGNSSDEIFWQYAERIFSWQWRSEDHSEAPLIFGPEADELELGLPQGMVASGFLANAYLVNFDRQIQELIASSDQELEDVKILDYCRYVDDIRIVVEAPMGIHGPRQREVLDVVAKRVAKALRLHCERLEARSILVFSDRKSSITPYRSISAQSNVSALMDVLNAEMSGTFDLDSLTQAVGGFDGLLWASEHIDDAPTVVSSRLSLATIAVSTTDVRDDTVKRFVAGRLSRLMRQRLAMTDSESYVDSQEISSDRVTKGAALAHEFESAARKLIKCWAENPSLVLLLRCGVDLFPHPKLLLPILEALSIKLFSPGRKLTDALREIRVAQYVAADLFRAGAVETGHRSLEEYPQGVDVEGYRETLGLFAKRLISEAGSPWYLLQQAYLYLASIGDLSLATKRRAPIPELEDYFALQRAMLYIPLNSIPLSRTLPLALVAQQIHPNARRFGAWLAEGLRLTEDEEEKENIVITVALNRPDLLAAALALPSRRPPEWRSFVPPGLLDSMRKLGGTRLSSSKDSELSLHRVMMSDENPFGQENGLLLLAQTLLKQAGIRAHLESGLSASEIRLRCSDWQEVQSLPSDENFLKIVSIDREKISNVLYERPIWVAPGKVWLYGLGRILRAALTGEFDFTSRRFVVTENVGRYSGLRSTWFKRRFGLLNTGSSLLDEPGPISPWLSSLLSTLLQWPGVDLRVSDASAAADASSPEELLIFVEGRISEQRALYGVRSRTPIYAIPTDEGAALQDRSVRIAVVQPLRPRLDDFDAKDPTHWTPAMLAEHRRHLAEICRLAYQQLVTWDSAQSNRTGKQGNAEPIVDIVLFPELAVHSEHVFLLRALSDKLRSSIFAGLTFIHSKRLNAPINQGIWVIRTETPGGGRNLQYVWQGKKHPIKPERAMGVKGYRPQVTLVELPIGARSPTRVAAAICYDATDLDLAADLRDKSDIFLVAAMNRDVQTFDNMVAALNFHMYQPVILANSGEFGGSTAQAPLPKHERLIAHVHGSNQVAVSVFEIDATPFKSAAVSKSPKELKTPPAGYRGR